MTHAKMQAGFICTQLLNELSLKVPVAQVLKEIERSLNHEHPGLSSFRSYLRIDLTCIFAFVSFCFRHRYPPVLMS